MLRDFKAWTFQRVTCLTKIQRSLVVTVVGEFIHLHSYRALATIVGHARGFPIGLLSNFGLQIQVLFDSMACYFGA